jgi:hypothetical protein
MSTRDPMSTRDLAAGAVTDALAVFIEASTAPLAKRVAYLERVVARPAPTQEEVNEALGALAKLEHSMAHASFLPPGWLTLARDAPPK